LGVGRNVRLAATPVIEGFGRRARKRKLLQIA
jgi:hypothetical protein